MDFAQQLQGAVAHLNEHLSTSVVRIGREPSRGAGIVIGDGRVLTNAHSLRDQTTTVSFGDGRQVQGRVLGVDRDGDLAVLEVDTAGASPVVWAEPDQAGPGTPVFAVAGSTDGLRVTFGTISLVGRSFRGPRGRLIEDGVEHTATVGRGGSGSPVVDETGAVIAINTHRTGDGLYLALPATVARRGRIDALSRGESPVRRHLGVALVPSFAAKRMRSAVGLPERDGVLVRGVEDSSPAAAAGIERGDLIIEAAGTSVASPEQLFAVLEQLGQAATLALTVVRGVEEHHLGLTFSEG